MKDDVEHMVKNVLIASLLLITLSCISLLLISGIDFNSIFSDKFSQVLFDPSFLGSFLGALISSSIALIVLFIQFNNQKKVRREDEYRKFHKYINLFSIELEWYLDKMTSEKIEKIVKSNNHINNKILRDSTVELIKHIKSIDDDVIMDDVYVRFATIKLVLNELETILSEDLKNIECKEDENFVMSSLKANQMILRQSSDEINKKLREAKRELRIKE
ncbi:hypothetical protein [Sporosarcina psychrophila]|uniref:hypothetical protein n=1 Tax=Sporosarcina psychrophila TaxID=1476 RepID=UPI00078EA8EC|nr:hypothetical protein [Sporosarcina psychrophila]AMQ06751.1 hypothetical protein AZE41_12855 [Sporosarcina psychrophila]